MDYPRNTLKRSVYPIFFPFTGIHDLQCDFIKVDLENLHTNILMIYFDATKLNSAEFCTRMAEVTPEESKKLEEDAALIRLSPRSHNIVRLVVYWEITDDHVKKVIKKIKYIVDEVKSKKS